MIALDARSTRLWAAGVTLLILVGLALRLAPIQSVFTPGHVNLVAADSHYYVRLAQLQWDAFPEIVTHDPLLGSSGSRVLWPLGHTLLVGAVMKVLGGDPEAAAAWVGPLLSLLLLLGVAFASRAKHGGRSSLVLLALLALIPAVVSSGFIGEADHHLHEPFLACFVLLVLAAGLERPDWKKAMWLALLLAGARLFTTTAFTLVVPVFAAIAIVGSLNRTKAKELRSFALVAGIGAATASTLHAVIMGQLQSLEYELASAFHPLLFLSCAALCGAVLSLRVAGAHSRRNAAGLLSLALLFVSPLFASAIRAAQHLGRKDPLLAVVMESRPLFSELGLAFGQLGVLLLLIPAALAWSAWRVRRERDTELIAAGVMTATFAIAAAFQLRFAPLLVGSAAVLLALAAPRFLEAIRAPRLRVLTATTFAAALMAVHVGPLPEIHPQYGSLRGPLQSLGARLAEFSNPAEKVVLANPFAGHFLMLWSDAAVVASPFSQLPEHAEAYSTVRAFFAAEEEEAHDIAAELRARFVLVTPGALTANEEEPADAQHWLLPHVCPEGRCVSAERFQLLQADEPQRGGFVYLFGRVEGARLTGSAASGAKVTLRTQLAPNGLWWRRTRIADAAGDFAFRLPYPTDSVPYTLTIEGERDKTFHVSESAVREGTRVGPPLTSGSSAP